MQRDCKSSGDDRGIKGSETARVRGDSHHLTLCFSAHQAYLAAKAGATYISPFLHRKKLAGEDGIQLVRQIRQIYDRYGYQTKVLAASIRTAKEVLDCLLTGSDAATMPFDIMESLYKHMMTDAGLTLFLEDWRKVPPSHLFEQAHASRAGIRSAEQESARRTKAS